MIIQNGYIRIKQKAEAVYDPKTGYYKAVSEPSWGEDNIPCQFRALEADLLAKSGANAVSSFRYEVLVELDVAVSNGLNEHTIGSNSVEQFRLFDMKDNLKGELSSESIAHLELVGIAKILAK